MSPDICFDTATVVCEPFQTTFGLVTYKDFLYHKTESNDSHEVVFERENMWDWDMLVTPYDKVIFTHSFTTADLTNLLSCLDFVKAERSKRRRRMRPGDPMRFTNGITFNENWAKYMVIGICR